MGRGNEQAQQASESGLGYSKALQGQQQSLYGTLSPALTQDVINPTGLTPQAKANANTAAQQSVGGSNAGAVGQGSLMAQRTRNAGTADAAIQGSAQAGGRTLANAALGTEMADEALKQRKQAAAKGEMGQLYGIQTGGATNALGEVAKNVDANSNAEDQSWDWAKYIYGPTIKAAGGACWIAEAIYGVDDTRTHIVRAWLNGPFADTVIGGAVMRLYLAIGQHIAAVARRSKMLRATLKPLFDAALNRALREM
jgi:hypothetical protein